MKQSKIRFNMDGLEHLKNGISKQYVARVGVLGDKATREHGDTDLNNAEIAIIQITGSFENNIPPRDCLLFPVEHERKQIVKEMQAGGVKAAFNRGDYKTVFKFLGIAAEGAIQRAFESSGFGQWAPNAQSTIDRKGSARPLIDWAELRKSFSSEVVKKGKL